MKDAQTNINGELFTHKILWACCEQQFKAADEANSKKEGTIYHELSAMLFAYLSYEAYINFLGEKVAPDAWEDERNFLIPIHIEELLASSRKYVRCAISMILIPERDHTRL